MKRLAVIILAFFLPGGCASHDPAPSNQAASLGDRVADWQLAHIATGDDGYLAVLHDRAVHEPRPETSGTAATRRTK